MTSWPMAGRLPMSPNGWRLERNPNNGKPMLRLRVKARCFDPRTCQSSAGACAPPAVLPRLMALLRRSVMAWMQFSHERIAQHCTALHSFAKRIAAGCASAVPASYIMASQKPPPKAPCPNVQAPKTARRPTGLRRAKKAARQIWIFHLSIWCAPVRR